MTERKRGRQRDASGARFNGHGRTLNDLLPQRPLLPLRSHAERALSDYFTSLNGSRPADLYDLVLREVEEPLFRVVLDYAEGNQSRAAGILGINRGTLAQEAQAARPRPLTRLKRWIRAPARPSAPRVKKRGFCPRLRHLRRRGTSLCLRRIRIGFVIQDRHESMQT